MSIIFEKKARVYDPLVTDTVATPLQGIADDLRNVGGVVMPLSLIRSHDVHANGHPPEHGKPLILDPIVMDQRLSAVPLYRVGILLSPATGRRPSFRLGI